MRELDQAFRELVAIPDVDRDAAEQLTHAARTLARMPASMATAITCTRNVSPEQRLAFATLARAFAAEHSLKVRVELGNLVRIRFTRAPRARLE